MGKVAKSVSPSDSSRLYVAYFNGQSWLCGPTLICARLGWPCRNAELPTREQEHKSGDVEKQSRVCVLCLFLEESKV